MATPRVPKSPKKPKPRWYRVLSDGSRWLHIYLSMVSFAILFFFAVTGLTLNHPAWFEGREKTIQAKGKMELKWLNNPDTSKIAKLEIVEKLRTDHKIKGALSDFRIDEMQCAVSFKGPGYFSDTFINRETGEYELSETRMGLIAVINDLHKGRDSGSAWSLIIDISAVLMTLVSLSGMILICFMKKKRFAGLLLAFIGTVASYLIYVIFVP